MYTIKTNCITSNVKKYFTSYKELCFLSTGFEGLYIGFVKAKEIMIRIRLKLNLFGCNRLLHFADKSVDYML